MKEIKKIWYESVTKTYCEKYEGIRLTDSQLARLISKDFGGEESKHLSNIRRSGCNQTSINQTKGEI